MEAAPGKGCKRHNSGLQTLNGKWVFWSYLTFATVLTLGCISTAGGLVRKANSWFSPSESLM